MSAKTGAQAKIWYKRGGVAAAGDYSELTIARDVTFGNERGEADATTRGNSGFKQYLPALKDVPLDIEVVYDPDNDGYDAFQDAYYDGAIIGLEILDGARATGTGLRADFFVSNFTRNEPLEDTMTVSMTLKLAYSDTDPEWVEAGATGTGTSPA